MVARWLENNKPKDTTISDFKNAGYKLKTKRQDTEGENKMDAKEERTYESFE